MSDLSDLARAACQAEAERVMAQRDADLLHARIAIKAGTYYGSRFRATKGSVIQILGAEMDRPYGCHLDGLPIWDVLWLNRSDFEVLA